MLPTSKMPKVHESNKVHDPDPERSCQNLTDWTWHSGYGAWRGGMWQRNIVVQRTPIKVIVVYALIIVVWEPPLK